MGADLSESYWGPGNSKTFLEYVKAMTGREFSADALVQEVSMTADEAVAAARKQVDGLDAIPERKGEPDLDISLRIIHGHEEVVPAGVALGEAARMFRSWVLEKWPR